MTVKTQKHQLKLLPAPSLAHSGARIAILSLWLRVKQLATPINLTLTGVGVYLALSTAFTASFFLPRSVNFSFAENNCFTSPTLLPDMVAKNQGDTFSATPQKSISIAGYPIYSHTTCVEPVQAPEEKLAENISFSPLGIGFLKKNIRVSAGSLPAVDFESPLGQPVSTKEPLVFPLSSSDQVFGYQLLVNDQKLLCSTEGYSVVCDVAKLNLEQSANYTFVMERLFDGKISKTLFAQTAATVGAVQIVASSVAAGQTVFDVPTEITLTLSKTAKSLGGVELNQVSGETRQAVPVTATLADQTVTVRFGQTLPRSTSFELSIKSIAATDGGHLPATFVLPFATSGGPKVKGVNIGSYKVTTSSNIVLTFDSAPAASQVLGNFIKLEINGSAVAASVSANGSTVTINPNASLPKCARFSVRVLDGLKNEFGISGGSAYQLNSRVICQTVFSIGTSVQGRGITAYRFGSGGSYVVFAGGMHGNEKSSVYTLNNWLDYLESHYDQIPGNRTIVVIPNLNPDAYAASKRTNANNVDLNRNFPANNWKQGVTMPGGSYNPNGGGAYPLSEPESSALANYILSVNPRLVLTYHATAGVVMPNDSGDSDALAKVYDQKSNLYYEPSSQTGQIFQYDTTGSFEEWLYDDHGIPTLLVELWTMGSSEFSKNQNAMWHMATLP